MRKKGQMDGLSIIMVAFIGILVAVLLYQAVGPYIGDMTGVNTVTASNVSFTFPENGSTVDLEGQELVGTVVVVNATDGVVVPTSNYTVAEGVGADGVKGIILTATAGDFAGVTTNATYVYEVDGYVDDAGARAMVLLIPILAALAIAVLALVPTFKAGMGKFGG